MCTGLKVAWYEPVVKDLRSLHLSNEDIVFVVVVVVVSGMQL